MQEPGTPLAVVPKDDGSRQGKIRRRGANAGRPPQRVSRRQPPADEIHQHPNLQHARHLPLRYKRIRMSVGVHAYRDNGIHRDLRLHA